MFKAKIQVVCGVALCCLTVLIINVYEYILDEDISRIDFKEFNSDENHIYPTITMCFTKPLLEDKLEQYGHNINSKTYNDYINGDLWDDRMATIDYDDVSIDFDSYLQGFQLFETTSWKTYRYHHNKASIQNIDERNQNLTPATWPPKFYTSSRGLFGKCWSVEIPFIKGKTIQSFGLIFSANIFENGIRPSQNEFGIIIHYPHQLLKADIGMYDWQSLENDNPGMFTMKYEIRNTMVVKRRLNSLIPCNEKWKEDDDAIYSRMYSKAGCKPSYSKIQDPQGLTACKTKYEMKLLYKSMLSVKSSSDHPPPCQEIEKLIFAYDELSWLVDDWVISTNANQTNSNQRKTQNMFEVLLNFNDGTYMEIQNTKAYDTWTLLGNAGGYVGLFLGYSLLQLFLNLPTVVKRFYTDMKIEVRNRRFPIIERNLKISKQGHDSKEHLELQDKAGISECTLSQDAQINQKNTQYLDSQKVGDKEKYKLIKRLAHENVAMREKIMIIRKEAEILKKKFSKLDFIIIARNEMTHDLSENEAWI